MVEVKWTIKFSNEAEKDKKKLKKCNLENKAKNILNRMIDNPFVIPPPYEKLVGSLDGYYSRRINIQHRLVYRVDKENKVIIIASMYSHY